MNDNTLKPCGAVPRCLTVDITARVLEGLTDRPPTRVRSPTAAWVGESDVIAAVFRSAVIVDILKRIAARLTERPLGEFTLLRLWIADLAEGAVEHGRSAAVFLTQSINAIRPWRAVVVPLTPSNALIAVVLKVTH